MTHQDRDIRVDAQGALATVTLNRPHRRNALSLAMWAKLASIFDELDKDRSVRAVVLAGSGGNFCSGADIKEFGETRSSPEQADHYAQTAHRAQDAIFRCSKPVIAAVDGFCIGGGFGLALCCDFRIVDEGARLGITAAKIGIVYGLRETQCLLAIAGMSSAKRILFGGELFSAAAMQRMGLADEVVAGDVAGHARRYAGALAGNAPLSIAGAKMILNGLAAGTGALDVEAADKAAADAIQSEDYRGAVRAFGNKQKPVFSGR